PLYIVRAQIGEQPTAHGVKPGGNGTATPCVTTCDTPVLASTAVACTSHKVSQQNNPAFAPLMQAAVCPGTCGAARLQTGGATVTVYSVVPALLMSYPVGGFPPGDGTVQAAGGEL